MPNGLTQTTRNPFTMRAFGLEHWPVHEYEAAIRAATEQIVVDIANGCFDPNTGLNIAPIRGIAR